MSTKIKSNDKNIIALIDVDKIKEPKYPVRTIADEDKLKELISSIKQYGLIHPIVVTKKGKGYEIFAGHRRYLACKSLGHKKIPCYIRTASEADRDFMKLQENTVREDITPVDQARYIKYMIDKYQFTHEEIAQKIGKKRPTVSNLLRLLTYPDYIQKAIEEGKLTATIAHILVQIDDPVVLKEYVRYAITDGLTQETALQWVRNYIEEKERQTQRVAPLPKQEEEKEQEQYQVKCTFCGRTSKTVPIEHLPICTVCRVNIEEAVEARLQEKS